MSAEAVEAAAGLNLRGSERLVMFALAWSTRQNSAAAVASLAKLASYAGLSEVQTRRILKSLEARGCIRRAAWSGRAVTWELTCLAHALSPHEMAQDERAALSPDEGAALSPHETHRKEKQNPSLRSAQRARASGYSVNHLGITFLAQDKRDEDCMGLISSHAEDEVRRAVETARSAEPRGRAFPSAVLKILQAGRASLAGSNSATAREYLNKRMRDFSLETMVIDI